MPQYLICMNNLVAYTVQLIQNEMKIESGNFKYIVIVQCLELGFFLKKKTVQGGGKGGI